MVAIFRCRSRPTSASGLYRSGLIMRAFLLAKRNSLIIDRPQPRLGDWDGRVTTLATVRTTALRHAHRAAPSQPQVDRVTLKARYLLLSRPLGLGRQELPVQGQVIGDHAVRPEAFGDPSTSFSGHTLGHRRVVQCPREELTKRNGVAGGA